MRQVNASYNVIVALALPPVFTCQCLEGILIIRCFIFINH
ncbi:hypothetical protein HMPREF0201_02187 [Cedecea davisae DSM 4568]|uniref:Uncharacterized protein n=1 Tax=Cedecea davisae DSM 4568 TaxID=566551 RepID=S3J9Z9_9ENTR|nr:hypothetical protein HMPREF0201_02187 [Cedecea davisae DSM 4568]